MLGKILKIPTINWSWNYRKDNWKNFSMNIGRKRKSTSRLRPIVQQGRKLSVKEHNILHGFFAFLFFIKLALRPFLMQLWLLGVKYCPQWRKIRLGSTDNWMCLSPERLQQGVLQKVSDDAMRPLSSLKVLGD